MRCSFDLMEKISGGHDIRDPPPGPSLSVIESRYQKLTLQ